MKTPLGKEFTSAFFGTPRFAVFVLEALERSGITPDVVVTAPDKPAGRGMKLASPPVKDWALERDIPVLQPFSLKIPEMLKERLKTEPPQPGQYPDIDHTEEAVRLLKNSEWDLFLVAAYGKILPGNIITLPRRGSLNVHPSLLPKFRGASPVESQILADEKTVGASIMLMDEKMDHGPILSQASVTPEAWPPKASVLEEMLATVGGELLAETIPRWMDGAITPEEQNHDRATFTKKIRKADGFIEQHKSGHPMSTFDTEGEYKKYLKYCAYDGWPGIFFMHEKNTGERVRVKITDAEYTNGVFTPRRVIPEGRKEVDYANFLHSL